MCKYILYIYNIYIYAYIHVRIPVNPQLERHTVNWTAIRQDRIGMYSPLSTAIGIKKMRFLSGKQQRWYIYIQSGFTIFYCSIFWVLYVQSIFYSQPNSNSSTKPVVLSPPGRRASGRPGSEMNCNTLCRPQPQWPQRVW